MNTNTVTIEIPKDIYDQASHLAEQDSRTLEDFLADRVIQSFVCEDFAESARDERMAQEQSAYEVLHPDLVKTYLHSYVAITGGRVVDTDEDELKLFYRIEEDYPDEIVLMREVKLNLPGELRVRSPRFENR